MFEALTDRHRASIAAPKATARKSIQEPDSSGRPLTILKVAPTSFFSDYGCHVRIYEECRVLRSRGHRVIICTYPTGDNVGDLDIRRAMNTPFLKSIRVGSSKRKPYYDALLLLKSLTSALSISPDVIHAHLHEGALIGLPLARLLRVPLVFDFQGSLTSEMIDHNFLSRSSRLYGPLRWLETRIDRLADRIITSSENAAVVLSQEFDVPSERIVTIIDRVNTEAFRPAAEHDQAQLAELRARLGIPRDRRVVVYLGLLAEYQGISKLLQAATRVVRDSAVPVHFLIMGWPASDTYQRMAVELGIGDYVTFPGRVPYREAPLYLALGDVAVSPKMSETEGNGKLLNYMATGLPTVTFDTPVAQEILGDLGLFAEFGSVESLADHLTVLIEQREWTATVGRRLRARAIERFEWTDAAPLFEQAYASTLKQVVHH